ncbi:MAG: hypothetical protein ACN4GZ_15750, partial [Acidimicrobiales bacterium]
MRQRLFNRLAQRYLVRGGELNVTVGRPGSDLAESTDWYLEETNAPGTFELFADPDRHRAMRIVDGKPVLVEVAAAADASGSWTIHPAGNNGEYW